MHNQWIQVNVQMNKKHKPAIDTAILIFAKLYEGLNIWQRENLVSGFFFQRKLPDIRLRFKILGQYKVSLNRIMSLMRILKDKKYVDEFFLSVYEPETRLFGGLQSTNRVHDFFTEDSFFWYKLTSSQQLISAGISELEYSAILINEIFTRTINDTTEIWDTWCNFADLLPNNNALPIYNTQTIWLRDSNLDTKHIEDVSKSLDNLSSSLLHIWKQGKLTRGLRSILPFIAIFHLNRYGISDSKFTETAIHMCNLWNPNKNHR